LCSLKVQAGDFVTFSPSHSYSKNWTDGNGTFHLATEERAFKLTNTEAIPSTELEFLALASEESVKKLGGTVGWGAAGGLLLGPVGLLAGLLLGGKKTKVTFIAKFKDGRKLIATTDPKTWVEIQSGGLHVI
jgi:hypothetical protein